MEKLIGILIVRIGVAFILTFIVGFLSGTILGLLGLSHMTKIICVITFIIGLFINPEDVLTE